MKLLARLAVAFYVTVFILIAVILGLFVLHQIPLGDVTDVLTAVYSDQQLRLTVGVIAILGLWINYLFAKSLASDYDKGKSLAFDNPGGRVTVSVSGLEDLVRRVMSRIPGVKDVRSSIKVVKKKLIVRARIAINADVNIPEMTSSLQELVRGRIQDTIGLEEPVEVHIHVVNMLPSPDKSKKVKEKAEEPVQEENKPSVPFRGYRA